MKATEVIGILPRVPNIPRGAQLLPIVWFEIYLAATVALYAWGPWPWPTKNAPQLYFFLFLAHVALLAGYLSAVRGTPRGKSHTRALRILVTAGAVIGLLMFVPTFLQRTGGAVSIPDMLDNLFADAGIRYNETRLATMLYQKSSVVEYIRVLLSPITWPLFPLTVVFWKWLSVTLRSAAMAAIIGNLLVHLAIGTNKGIADAIILLPCFILVRRFHERHYPNVRDRFQVVILFVLGMSLFIPFFGMNIAGRYGMVSTPDFDFQAKIGVDNEHPLLRYLPEALQDGTRSLSAYITEGYYGLSLALDKPFVPCYGWGNSYFLIGLLEHYQGRYTALRRTYPGRIEDEGWAADLKWDTIYPWIASDVGFPGTILVVFLIGRLLALAWIDSIGAGNLLAVVLLSHLIIMISYFPCNNQVLQNAETWPTFWVTLGLWLWDRRKRSEEVERKVSRTS